MNKRLLIFTGVGDNEDHFISWAYQSNIIFDRALNYYGDDHQRMRFLKSLDTEFFYINKGMIWENFYRNYYHYNSYDYYLIVDSDLYLDIEYIQQSLDYMIKHNSHGAAWSRTDDSYGYFNSLFLPRNIKNEIYYSNWIEMCFMLLSKKLVENTVAKWKDLRLSWSTGIDFVVANVAAENKMLPFIIFNNFTFKNIHPEEKKNGREIDIITKTTTEERLREILDLMEKNNFFQIKPIDILTWER